MTRPAEQRAAAVFTFQHKLASPLVSRVLSPSPPAARSPGRHSPCVWLKYPLMGSSCLPATAEGERQPGDRGQVEHAQTGPLVPACCTPARSVVPGRCAGLYQRLPPCHPRHPGTGLTPAQAIAPHGCPHSCSVWVPVGREGRRRPETERAPVGCSRQARGVESRLTPAVFHFVNKHVKTWKQ